MRERIDSRSDSPTKVEFMLSIRSQLHALLLSIRLDCLKDLLSVCVSNACYLFVRSRLFFICFFLYVRACKTIGICSAYHKTCAFSELLDEFVRFCAQKLPVARPGLLLPLPLRTPGPFLLSIRAGLAKPLEFAQHITKHSHFYNYFMILRDFAH